MSVHAINFKPNPLQRQFIESRAKADLFSSRMGEGKSAALAWSVLYHTRHNPGATWYIIRDTWENLRATTMEEFFKWFPPGVMGSWHATHKEFTWAEGVARGKVGFLGMDSPDDASKLMSRQMAGFAMDEPAPAVGSVGIDEMIFTVAMTRLRQEGMKWYGAKLAENNPDETHWTYKRFVVPGTEGYALWQPSTPENMHNLPPTYYQDLRRDLQHRPDLVRRFVDGDFGFQIVGRAVTPQWNDKLHLANGLIPLPGSDLFLLWDFGHNPTCIVTQRTPLGHWHILDSLVGDGIGTAELIMDGVRPLLQERYGFTQRGGKYTLRHIGDPAGEAGEQSSIKVSAVRLLLRELGGTWRKGPIKVHERTEPLRSVLTRTLEGRGVVQVDRHRAQEVWQALRGGWHFHVARNGIVSSEPFKDQHSHPGDAMGYGAAILYPMGRMQQRGKVAVREPRGYFGGGRKVVTPAPVPLRQGDKLLPRQVGTT